MNNYIHIHIYIKYLQNFSFGIPIYNTYFLNVFLIYAYFMLSRQRSVRFPKLRIYYLYFT